MSAELFLEAKNSGAALRPYRFGCVKYLSQWSLSAKDTDRVILSALSPPSGETLKASFHCTGI